MNVSKMIDKADIQSGRCFSTSWLNQQGFRKASGMLKIGLQGRLSKLADGITPTKATWNGCNASGWRSDILSVNGHNETMQYGGQDRELGERLINFGLQTKQFRHRATLLLLDHPRGYKTRASIERNLAIRATTRNSESTWTTHGIIKPTSPLKTQDREFTS